MTITKIPLEAWCVIGIEIVAMLGMLLFLIKTIKKENSEHENK